MYIGSKTQRISAGDTIIEVMIALAIIGLVISMSYATTQRSLKTGQAAQERIEALKVAESQVETLKAMRTLTTVPNIFTTSPLDSFCVDPATATLTTQSSIAPGVTTLNTGVGPNLFNASCQKGFDGRYYASITRVTTPGPNPASTFTVRVLWSGIITNSGISIQELNLVYRLHGV